MNTQKNNSEEKMREVGKKMQKMGCAMTFMITLPILGAAFIGLPGLLIGLVIAGIGMVGIWSGDDKKNN